MSDEPELDGQTNLGSDDLWAAFGEESEYSVLLDENPSLLDTSI